MAPRVRQSQRSPRYRRQKRILLTLASLVLALFVALLGSWGFLNYHFTSQVRGQYQSWDNRTLKTSVPAATRSALQDSQDRWEWALTRNSQKAWEYFTADWQARAKRTAAVAALYAGRDDYRDGVTTDQLHKLDQSLLQEKNQTVYQRQKNNLDTVQVWFQQTTDADAFLQKLYSNYTATKVLPNLQQMAQAKAYFSLIRNKTIKNKWTQPVAQMQSAFDKNTSATKEAQQKAEQETLDSLKNAPLTKGYIPAQVNITENGQTVAGSNETDYDSILSNANVTAANVLFVDQATKTAHFLRRSAGHYSTSGDALTLDAVTLAGGRYAVAAVITNGAQGAVVTDTTASDFGQYYATPSAAPASSPVQGSGNDNATSDFNDATPVFWLKNNTDLQNSVLLKGTSTIGFVSAGASTLGNMISGSAVYQTIVSRMTTATVVYVY
ncbi:MAG: hypothetical protein LKI92_11760 [Schleiferilactobacillus harbinensis]|nr:hypothetical protein [Schleiferilactobacillus harbinensis]MCI1913793.1 hypothetical protein [Schleiferilactobacillus harbinensis]